MLLRYIFATFLWMIATLLPRRWDATQLKKLLICIIANGLRNRSTFLMVDILLHLLWLRSFLNLAYLLVFIMTILSFNRNRNHFSKFLANFLFSIFTVIR